jgi:hypothetical protein
MMDKESSKYDAIKSNIEQQAVEQYKNGLLDIFKERFDDYTKFIANTSVISYQDSARYMQKETKVIMEIIKDLESGDLDNAVEL